MNWLRSSLLKLRWLARRRQAEAEMAEEMRFHLEAREEEAISEGATAEDARFAAHRRFGNVGLVQERCRDQRVWAWFERLRCDFRLGARSLARSPGFTAIALLTLALGIGANTSMYSLMSALMLRTPYPRDAELVRVFHVSKYSRHWPHSPASYLDHQSGNTVFTQEAATTGVRMDLARDGAPAESLHGMKVTAGFFPLLGVKPEIGRWFSSQEDVPGADNVAILSHGLWVQRFGGDPAILGRRIHLDAGWVRVIGVMPEKFDDPLLWGAVEIYRPMAWTAEDRGNRGHNFVGEIARLKPGVSLARAQSEMSALVANLDRVHPENAGDGVRLVPLARTSQDDSGQSLSGLVMSLAGLVLLIGCANLANLQYARYSARAREQAIRAALGASRGRLMRSIIIECLELAFAGGVLAIGVATLANAWLRSHILVDGTPMPALPLDWPVIGFLFAVATATGIGFGLLPAWLLTRGDVSSGLKLGGTGATAGRGHLRVRLTLVAAEVALALTLLAAASFYIRGVGNMLRRDLGWTPQHALVGWVNLDARRYADAKRRQSFFDQSVERLSAIPGVSVAAIGNQIPIQGFMATTTFETPDLAGSRERDFVGLSAIASVSPSYFAAMGMPLLQGRTFAATDRDGSAKVAIVNETLARRFWPGRDPIGQRVAYSGDHPDWWQVVGVVPDVHPSVEFSHSETQFQIYRPLPQASDAYQAVIVRTLGDPAPLIGPVREALRRIDPDVALFELSPAEEQNKRAFEVFYVGVGLLSWFAGLGIFLAALGVYGVISGWVIQRTGEIGVRIALGAQTSDILSLVLSAGMKVVLVGVALGALGAWAVGRGLATIMDNASPVDVTTAIAVTLLLFVTSTVACLLPARRAAKIDPVIALRGDA